MIRLSNVIKSFDTKQGTLTAVDNVNLSIESGEIYGIIGYSGAGKSTLVRMFNGLEKPTKGEITLGDSVISKLTGKALREKRQKIGMIFQHFNLLWSRTVLENILLPLEIAKVPKHDQLEKAYELIRLVGLEGREDAYPAELSGGQKQRVGIARALANEPTLLLCDEATSALDPQTTDEVLELLLEINKRLNLTIVMITHEMHVVRKICHKVAVMEKGKIVEEGDVLEVFKRPQQEITKRFIRQDTDPESEETDIVLAQVFKDYPDGKLLHLTFNAENSKQPVLSQLIRHHDIELNVIQGSIQQTQSGSIGSLYVQVTGDSTEISSVLADLSKMNVEAEVIEHV
ncbi:methionine ABC transporter ATP-binding protein [Desemzia incerta]|uniref:methionine ABC transporter ATP-binding protein n=1 Tax=Desemzia incerta TaxID=82801 RepID=UPI0024C35D74|nr:methionine ABC transporter ATP-binding protein [Desemzia incerta]WHZ31143.1 methionine ABC transporter ATP-binding protein [Desemzia incerta]